MELPMGSDRRASYASTSYTSRRFNANACPEDGGPKRNDHRRIYRRLVRLYPRSDYEDWKQSVPSDVESVRCGWHSFGQAIVHRHRTDWLPIKWNARRLGLRLNRRAGRRNLQCAMG